MGKGVKFIMIVFFTRYVTLVTFCLTSSVYASNTSKSDSDINRTSPKLTQPGIIKNLTEANMDNALEIAMDFIKQSGHAQGLTSLDFVDMIVTDKYVSKDTGITHIYFRQRYKGIEVFNANININIAKDGSVINMSNSFCPNLNNAINTTAPTLSAIWAVELASQHLGLSVVKPLEILQNIGGPDREAIISDGGISLEDIPVKLVFQPVGKRKVRLAWNIEIYELNSNHYWSLKVDTETGKVLSQVDFVDNTVDSLY